MARTIYEFETNRNAVIIHYQSLSGFPFDGEKPRGCVCCYYGWFIRASIFFKGFLVYKDVVSKTFHFNDLKGAKRFIISQVNRNRTLNFEIV